MKKIINELTIWIEGTWCEVKDNNTDKFVYEGSIAEDITHEEVYKRLTDMLEFRLNGKTLVSYTLCDTFAGERQATLENLAYENNCSIDDIEQIIVSKEIKAS